MKHTRKTKGKPDAFDMALGQVIRQRRAMVNLSQEKLAEAVGLTFQQIQKYERGTNRIACSRLVKLAVPLDRPAPFLIMDAMNTQIQKGAGHAR